MYERWGLAGKRCRGSMGLPGRATSAIQHFLIFDGPALAEAARGLHAIPRWWRPGMRCYKIRKHRVRSGGCGGES